MAIRQDASTGQLIDDHQPDKPAGGDKPTMSLKVYSPFKIYYDDECFSVSAVNDTGPFDILPHHHNFITLVNACTLAIDAPRGAETIDISGGLMHIKSDKVILFLNI